MALTDKLTAIADGFRESRGTSPKYSLDHMAILAAEPLLYTNLIHDSIDTTGAIFNGKGWADNARIGSGILDSYIGKGSYYITGYIAIDPTIDNTIRMKNVTFDSATTDTYIGVAFYDAGFNRVSAIADNSATNWIIPSTIANTVNGYDTVLDGTNIVEFTLKNGVHIDNTAIKYMAICAGYIGTDSVITINQALSGSAQPSGTLDVTENGTHDVKNYAFVNVNVAGGSSSDGILRVVENVVNIGVGVSVTAEKYYTHFLYNGVRLPRIPDDVLKNYPYAWIRDNGSTGQYQLILSATGFYLDSNALADKNSVINQQYNITKSDTSANDWVNADNSQFYRWGLDENRTVLWSNHDIPNGSATATDIYFAGSEPVPTD